MIDALPLLLSDEGYQISRSVRLRSSASAYFSRTLTTPTNNKIWTWSAWVKRGRASGTSASAMTLFATGSASTDAATTELRFDNERLVLSGFSTNWLISNAVYRDPSAWYHIVVAWDNSNATASNRIKIYVNGLEISYATDNRTSLSTTATYGINQAVLHTLGAWSWNNGSFAQPQYYDGYLTEINFIDGQALTPSSFGETNPVTGVWQPKRYTGTYGTNGFYLNFSDPSAATAAAIGADRSGNGNNWTPNNISVTAGATYDSMLDVPTQWADGGNGRGNYAVVNPISSAGTALSVTAGNLNFSQGSSLYGLNVCSMSIRTKTYFEITLGSSATGAGRNSYCGVGSSGSANAYSTSGFFGTDSSAWSLGYSNTTAYTSNNNSQTTQSGTVANGDVFMYAVDPENGRIWFGRNGTWYAGDPAAGTGASYTNLPSEVFPVVQAYNSGTHSINFGQRPFAYTPPSGFRALNTLNLPTPTIAKGNQYFDATLWTGDGTGNRAITNSGLMQPDLVWLKIRNQAFFHRLTDSVRGATKELYSNATDAEFTQSQGLLSFDASGFTVGTSTSYNGSGNTYVGWQWKEGATQGFDIVTGTSTGTTGTLTLAHSLGVEPAMVIAKNRNVADDWYTWHTSLGVSSAGNAIRLNTTAAKFTSTGIWGTGFTSSNLFFGQTNWFTASGQGIVAYAFAEVAGFSRAFSYTGNGSADGPFIFLGFRPRWIMLKRTDSANDWLIIDTSRNSHNVTNLNLWANLSSAEGTADRTDILSNGFKLRNNLAEHNASGGTYIGMAFAEAPFKFSLGR